jgi:putative GTP pyrophosphokinase
MSLLDMMAPKSRPPWSSKGLINRAGQAFREHREPTEQELESFNSWRGAHKYILNTFQANLRNRTRGTGIIVAQRLKRRHTIIDKLSREPQMQLARMDDVAGCRMIFDSIPALDEFRAKFHKARFRHKRKNDKDKYNYIKNPRSTGYRGIHDIYEYRAITDEGKPYNGLLLELQYRTQVQHAWATSVEVVSRITENQPKFEKGDERYIEFFQLASEIMARVHEKTCSCYKDVSRADLIARFEALDADINLVRMLHSLHTIYTGADGGNLILQFSQHGNLLIHQVADQEATEAYFRLEKDNPGDDIVLVSADTFDEIRSAYRNYFSDPRDFLRYLHEASQGLGGKGCLTDGM